MEEEDEEPLSLIISLFLICSMGVSSVIMETNWRKREDSIFLKKKQKNMEIFL